MINQTEDQLGVRLKGLRRDIEPETDLWPGIAARLEREASPAAPRRSRLRRIVPLAMAASMVLAIGVTWQVETSNQPEHLIHSEAVAMAEDYEAALDAYSQTPLQPELQPVLEDLDRDAGRILSAIERYPEARFLLDQLRRTYDRRLELTQRAIITT